jgi:hypothetical protein
MSLELWIGVAALVIAAISAASWAVYIIARIKYNPRIEFTIGPQGGDEPIRLRQDGDLTFTVSSRSKYKVELDEVWVKFNRSDKVELSLYDDEGPTVREVKLTGDKEFPLAIYFTGPFIVAEKCTHGFFFHYKAQPTSGMFRLKFETVAKVSESEVSFPFDILPRKTVRCSRVANFKAEAGVPVLGN